MSNFVAAGVTAVRDRQRDQLLARAVHRLRERAEQRRSCANDSAPSSRPPMARAWSNAEARSTLRGDLGERLLVAGLTSGRDGQIP
jgi:hypothetical protein